MNISFEIIFFMFMNIIQVTYHIIEKQLQEE